MTKKLTTAIATELVKRIETLQAQIDAVYSHAADYEGGYGNSNVIRDAVKERKSMLEAEYSASSLLASFDAEDDPA